MGSRPNFDRSQRRCAGAVVCWLRRLWSGLAAGVVFVMVQPPALTSTTLVLLPTPALADSSSSDVATQVHIALSATVLGRAGQAVAPPLPARSVEKMVEVSAPTSQLLQIDATSTNAAEAQTLSQAVADSYVGYVSNTAREVSSAALADLKVRRDELQKQISQLQADIAAAIKRQQAVDPASQDGRKEAQLLAGLRTRTSRLVSAAREGRGQDSHWRPCGFIRHRRHLRHPAGDGSPRPPNPRAAAHLGTPRCLDLPDLGGRGPARGNTARPAV